MKFSKWLDSQLKKRDMLPSELSYSSQISQAEISRLLSGKRTPSLKTIKKIALALHVSEEECMKAAGFINNGSHEDDLLSVIIKSEVPNSDFDSSKNLNKMLISRDIINDDSVFALKVTGDMLRAHNLFDGDIVFISPASILSNGDIAAALIGKKLTLGKWHATSTPDSKQKRIIFIPGDPSLGPILITQNMKQVKVFGKMVLSIKKH